MAKVEYVSSGYVSEGYYQTGISIDWDTYTIHIPKLFSAQIQTVPSEVRSMDLNLLRIALKDIEDSAVGMAYPDTHSHNTTIEVGGVILSRVIAILEPYTITFEDGPYAINLVGANSNVGDRVNVNQVSVRSANSAGLQDLSTLLASAYQGRVVLDVANGQSGTTRPIGTVGAPSNNLPDTRVILDTEGLAVVRVQGPLTIDTGDFSDGIVFEGQNPVSGSVVIQDLANVNSCEFRDLSVTGVVDNDNVFKNCLVSNVTSYDGTLKECGIAGSVSLGGEGDTTMEACYTISGTATINIGSGSGLNLSLYSGNLNLANKTGTDPTVVDMASGIVSIDSSCISGTIEVRGNGTLIDNSGIGCYVVDRMVSGSKLTNLQPLIELTRRSHGASGNTIYWDPHAGLDTNDGLHRERGKKTFVAAQALAVPGGHDLIIAVSNDPSGSTEVDENITISVEALRVRALARSLRLATSSTILPAVHITADNAEFSGFTISTPPTCSSYAIEVAGVSNTLVAENWVFEGGKGVRISGASRDTTLRHVRVAHNTGIGLSIEDTAEHTSVEDCHISSNSGTGISVTSTGHETSVAKGTVIHGNGAWGIDIAANATGIHILEDVTIYGNTSGQVNDLASDTFDESASVGSRVWGVSLASLTDTASIGYFIRKKLLTVAKFIGLK